MKKHANKYLKAVISRSLCDVLEIPYMTYTVDVADKKRDIYLLSGHSDVIGLEFSRSDLMLSIGY